jgi:hypothetical protein
MKHTFPVGIKVSGNVGQELGIRIYFIVGKAYSLAVTAPHSSAGEDSSRLSQHDWLEELSQPSPPPHVITLLEILSEALLGFPRCVQIIFLQIGRLRGRRILGH